MIDQRDTDPPRWVGYAIIALMLAALILIIVTAASSSAQATAEAPPTEKPTGDIADLLVAVPGSSPEQSEPPLAVSTSGWATWCAPTPKYCHGWGRPALLGAVRSFRWGDKPYSVLVRYGGKRVAVRVVSFCACGPRNGVPTVIDLSPEAFIRLAGSTDPGRIRVTVEAAIALPATDTLEQPLISP